jgi:glutaredoxin-related protein
MIVDMQSPNEIYLRVGREVAAILQALGNTSPDQKLAQQQNDARVILQSVQQNLDDAIADLQAHSEWDTFTLAFYGETSAGKSTLIETLRILLNEGTKVQQRTRFRQLQDEHGLSESSLQQLEMQIAQVDEKLAAIQGQLETVAQDFDRQDAALSVELSSLIQCIADKKRNASLFQRLLNALRQLPEEKLLGQRRAVVEPLKVQRQSALQVIEQQRTQLQAARVDYHDRQQQALDGLSQLAAYADGGIIGDGRLDFTRQTQRYDFSVSSQAFALLDVPGIEGDEKKVRDEIDSAVKKAHAVFYVTGKPTAPQKGDKERQGTLEKIKAHLGAQTEVWTLFNKRITNPMPLSKPTLISDDEKASLLDLDVKMREQLGENYESSIALSAWPAFLAAADCFVPRSSEAISQSKFLEKLSAEQMLEKSGIRAFCDHLTGNLVKDHKAKIKRSNLHKVKGEVIKVSDQLSTLRSKEFRPLEEELRVEAKSAKAQLAYALEALENRLTARGEQAIRKFQTTIRQDVYGRIDDDVSNDEFRRTLEQSIERQQKTLERELPAMMQAEVDAFAQQIAAVIARFEAHATDLLATYSKLRVGGLDAPFKLNIEIDNGLNVLGLLGTLAGGAVMFWNPAGWVIMALGGITLLFSFAKAIWSVFDSDYKKGQQRKVVNENLEKIVSQLEDALRDSLSSALPDLKLKVAEVCSDLDAPVNQITAINKVLGSSCSQLIQLSKEIQIEGSR